MLDTMIQTQRETGDAFRQTQLFPLTPADVRRLLALSDQTIPREVRKTVSPRLTENAARLPRIRR